MSGNNTESFKNRLTSIQSDFLTAFFASDDHFFLTGGAALIGFYGLTRATKDLDLFTLDEDAFGHSEQSIKQVAEIIGLELSVLRAFPHFRRYHLQSDSETLELDIVCEFAPQVFPNKPIIDGVRLDSLDEIAVNKVCALVGRSEVRDLWDLHQILKRGYNLEDLIEKANKKDGGVDLESTVFVLSSLNWEALTRAAERVELEAFHEVKERFQQEARRLALKLLPPR